MTGNNAIRSLGDTKTPSIIMLIGAGSNIILDPLLIFGIGPFPRLEIAGAAIATVIARAITFTVSLYVLIHREKMITFNIFPFKNVIDSWKQILFIGLPTSATRLIAPIAIGFVTALMATYGTEAVAAFGVSSRIEFFALAIVMALASVISPFVGQNWGAKILKRVNLGVKQSNLFALAWGLFAFVLLALIARPLASIFNNDPMVVSTTVLYLRIVPIGFGLIGVLIISSSVLNVLHKPLHSAFLMLTMMFALFVPLAFFGSRLFGIPGIFAGIAIAYIISGIIAHFTLSRVLVAEEKKIA
jgi:Na+-driven multidrug efflux pump